MSLSGIGEPHVPASERARDIGLLILRLSSGGTMLLAHGWGKLMRFSTLSEKFPDPIGLGSGFSAGLAVFAEVGCAFLLVIGLGTRFAAFPLLVTMLVAAFVIHGDDPFSKQELALLYAAPYLTLLLTGGGRYSLDRAISNRRGRGSIKLQF